MYSANDVAPGAALSITSALLAAGAAINARNGAGYTALSIVTGDPDLPGYDATVQSPISQLLIQHGGQR